jgi:glycosyltransferase involved in cell wall biosynthesis
VTIQENGRKITVVVPFLNEEDNLPVLWERLKKSMADQPEALSLLLVDDGSTDGSVAWAKQAAGDDLRVRLVRLSRNFGHQLAITAGLDRADGDAVVIMDADLQDPPEVIPALLSKWREGFDVVYAVRRSRAGETWLKKILAASFYRLFHQLAKVKVPMNAGDFRLIDRDVVNAMRQVRELHRFMRGLTCWVGFRQAAVEYDRDVRHAGVTKYPVWKSIQLAVDAITSFSASPLRWVMGMGWLVSLAGFVACVGIVIAKMLHPEQNVAGWTSMIAALLLFSGVQLLAIGVVGQYIGQIFEEVKKRPLYFVREDTGDRA